MLAKRRGHVAAMVLFAVITAMIFDASPRCGAAWAVTDAETVLAARIAAIIRDADEAIAKQDWETANRLITHGMAVLGEEYYLPDVDDDTSLKTAAADDQERRGNFANAVKMRRNSLASRLALLKRKIGE